MEKGIEPIPTVPLTYVKTAVPVASLKVVGWTFCGLESRPPLTGKVELLPEPENPSDPGAIAVVEDGVRVGYVARKTLAPVHTLLAHHLSNVRGSVGMHISEMQFPILACVIEPDDLGAPYGHLLIIGMDGSGHVVNGKCEIIPLVDVPMSSKWDVVIENPTAHPDQPRIAAHEATSAKPVQLSGGSHNVRLTYETPVSGAMVRLKYADTNTRLVSMTPCNE